MTQGSGCATGSAPDCRTLPGVRHAPEDRTPEQQAAVAYSDELIEEIKHAQTIVLGVPMYNFSVPSTLRAYFDHIARAGVTFRYTSAGPEGLLQGKRAYVFVTRGGLYADGTDTQTPYLRQFLGFVGIEPQFVYAEGLAMGEEARQQSLAAARHAIAETRRIGTRSVRLADANSEFTLRQPRKRDRNVQSHGRSVLSGFSGNPAQRLLEDFDGLPALNQISVIDDD